MKTWLYLMFFFIPLSMIFNIHQSKMYLQTRASITSLQRRQNQLLEDNQRIIAEMARSSAPTTIEQLARSQGARLGKISPNQILRIIVPEENFRP